MIVKRILTRIYVNDINQAIDFYERLLNEKCMFRFEYPQGGLTIAQINNLLIIAGSDVALETYRTTSASILVDSVEEYKEFLIKSEASILQDIQQVPTGLNMTIKHKDGTVFEYIEHTQPK